ncbi:MAG: diguanylate cyclase [Alphaproteobacteria bacterium]|nr:diguanylate cyclase [Alphaproteobacteria bacterium]
MSVIKPKPAIEATDILADAALTPEQRKAWNSFRDEAAAANKKIADLEKRIKHHMREELDEATAASMILTRPEFNREVARMLALDERYGGISSVLYFDFDNLPSLAEKYDRAIMNAAVRQVGEIMVRHVRSCDIVARLDATEFGVLLIRCDNDNAWRKGESLAVILQEKMAEVHGNPFELEVSFGAYTFQNEDDVTKGLHAAAGAMTTKKDRA